MTIKTLALERSELLDAFAHEFPDTLALHRGEVGEAFAHHPPEALALARGELGDAFAHEPLDTLALHRGELGVTFAHRALDAALHFRCAEFFMVPSDPRKEPLRKRLIAMFREAAGVPAGARREVVCGDWRLPAWHFSADASTGTMVVFGGFDSYIEEFFPLLASLRDKGWNVIGFEGPGQGSVLEEQRLPLTRDWHRPVAAVLDAFRLDEDTGRYLAWRVPGHSRGGVRASGPSRCGIRRAVGFL